MKLRDWMFLGFLLIGLTLEIGCGGGAPPLPDDSASPDAPVDDPSLDTEVPPP